MLCPFKSCQIKSCHVDSTVSQVTTVFKKKKKSLNFVTSLLMTVTGTVYFRQQYLIPSCQKLLQSNEENLSRGQCCLQADNGHMPKFLKTCLRRMKSCPLRILSYGSNNLFSLLTHTYFTTGLIDMQLLYSTSGHQKTIKWFKLIQVTI